MNNADHPMWAIIRQAMLLLVIGITWPICYKSGLVTADIIPIITLMLTVAGVDISKAVITHRQKYGNEQ